ncbi:MAG: hypothetical protein ABI770_06645 [Sphingomicrobium sp.]
MPKVSPYFYLAMGLAWLVLAILRIFVHAQHGFWDYLTAVVAVGSFGQFVWAKWKRPHA